MPAARLRGMGTINRNVEAPSGNVLALTYQVRTVLGDTRPVVRWYGDGSANCPYCGYALSAERGEIRDGACHNPWCDANPSYAAERLVSARAERAAREREQAAEAERMRWRREYAAHRATDHQAWLDATYAEARRRGACLACVIAPGWERARFVRHRRPEACQRRKRA
jgi:hypothetical protein